MSDEASQNMTRPGVPQWCEDAAAEIEAIWTATMRPSIAAIIAKHAPQRLPSAAESAERMYGYKPTGLNTIDALAAEGLYNATTPNNYACDPTHGSYLPEASGVENSNATAHDLLAAAVDEHGMTDADLMSFATGWILSTKEQFAEKDATIAELQSKLTGCEKAIDELRASLGKWESDPQYQYGGPGPINRLAIECRNEQLDERLKQLTAIGDALGFKGGWGEGAVKLIEFAVAIRTRAEAAEAKCAELEQQLDATECSHSDEEAAHQETLAQLAAATERITALSQAKGGECDD